MSHSEAGPSRRRRQYVSRACNSCRRRRIKCDGVLPVCAPCSTAGHECSWVADGEDGGRPATKQYVESLRVKIQQLESEITQLKRGQHQTESLNASSHPLTTLTDPSPSESFWGVTRTPPTTAFGQPLPDIHPSPPPHPHNLAELPRPAQPVQVHPVEVPVAIPPASLAPRYQYIFNIDASLSLDEQYPAHRASLVCQWDRYLPDLSPLQFPRLEHDTILYRCFSYGASSTFGMIPDLFLAELLEHLAPETTDSVPIQSSRYYTPLLHCSLLAFGAGLSDAPDIKAMETRGKFAAQAKTWLDDEFNNPSSSLALSLALLSEYHSGIGERNTGHMYMGMAVRAARTPSNPSNPRAQDWHRWSTFVQGKYRNGNIGAKAPQLIQFPLSECLMALEINGPNDLPAPRVPIGCPVVIEPDGRPPLTDSLTELLDHPDYFKFSARCFIQTCKLMVIATRMIGHPENDQQTILDIHLQLETWFSALPEGVLIRQRSVYTFPPVLALHITYWWFILHSHLALTEQISMSMTESVRDLSIKMCSRATEKIIQLLQAFDKQYGLMYFPRNLIKAIHACGSALVTERDSASSASRKKRATATEGIEACISALKTVGDVWPVAIQMCDELEAQAKLESSE